MSARGELIVILWLAFVGGKRVAEGSMGDPCDPRHISTPPQSLGCPLDHY